VTAAALRSREVAVDQLTKGSLCSGYGGLDLATPGVLRFLAEINADASAVLSREYPGVRNVGDLSTRQWSARDRVGLLTAGFPCQPVSAAGGQKAQNDHRWLWPAVLDVITRIRPAEVFLENVRNIVSIQRGAILSEILTALSGIGYECRWTVLGACAVGAPHHRHRWFLRARRTRGRIAEPVQLLNKCGAPRSGGRLLLPTPTVADGKGGPGASGRDGGLNLRTAVQMLPTPTALLPTPVARDADGRGEGTPEYWANRRRERPTQGIPLGAEINLLPTPRASDGKHGGPNQGIASGDIALSSACQPERWGRFAEAVALWELLLGRDAPEPTVEAPRGGRRLNPALSEWMMGLPAGLVTDGVDRSAALRLAGNGVVPAAAAAAYTQLGVEQ
jgi:DNA (cytosine-5)-methyltransferase 1